MFPILFIFFGTDIDNYQLLILVRKKIYKQKNKKIKKHKEKLNRISESFLFVLFFLFFL